MPLNVTRCAYQYTQALLYNYRVDPRADYKGPIEHGETSRQRCHGRCLDSNRSMAGMRKNDHVAHSPVSPPLSFVPK